MTVVGPLITAIHQGLILERGTCEVESKVASSAWYHRCSPAGPEGEWDFRSCSEAIYLTRGYRIRRDSTCHS